MDLVVLPKASAQSYDQALSIYHEETEGAQDAAEWLRRFVDDVITELGERSWPFDEPLVLHSHVVFTIHHEEWESYVRQLVKQAHEHDLTVLDPQEEALFPPGSPYVTSE